MKKTIFFTYLIRFRFILGFLIISIQLNVWNWLLIWFYLELFMMELYLGMHAVKLRFLWMMGWTHFFCGYFGQIRIGYAWDFLDSKESFFEVYFGSDLVSINEYGFESHKVQSWLGLIKMLGLDQICLGLIF